MRPTRIELFRLSGVLAGAVAAAYAAVQGDWLFAIVFLVADVVLALGVVHRMRNPQ